MWVISSMDYYAALKRGENNDNEVNTGADTYWVVTMWRVLFLSAPGTLWHRYQHKNEWRRRSSMTLGSASTGQHFWMWTQAVRPQMRPKGRRVDCGWSKCCVHVKEGKHDGHVFKTVWNSSSPGCREFRGWTVWSGISKEQQTRGFRFLQPLWWLQPTAWKANQGTHFHLLGVPENPE